MAVDKGFPIASRQQAYCTLVLYNVTNTCNLLFFQIESHFSLNFSKFNAFFQVRKIHDFKDGGSAVTQNHLTRLLQSEQCFKMLKHSLFMNQMTGRMFPDSPPR